MNIRIILQPIMAIIFATLDGRKDAREGRSPYFWSLFTEPWHRRELIRDGWKSVGKIFILAIILDAIYQFKVLDRFYPGEALLVASLLAVIPYVLIRGLVNRILTRKKTNETHEPQPQPQR